MATKTTAAAETAETETVEATEPAGMTIQDLTTKVNEAAGKEIEAHNLRATLRNLVKKGKLTHEPRTRWSFTDEEVDLVLEHYTKGGDEADKAEAKAAREAKKAKAPAKDKPAAEAEVEIDEVEDDELEIEDI